MKIARKSRRLIDQVFIRGRGWIAFKPMPLRRLWWAEHQRRFRGVESVHFVEFGDYRISELVGGQTPGVKAAAEVLEAARMAEVVQG